MTSGRGRLTGDGHAVAVVCRSRSRPSSVGVLSVVARRRLALVLGLGALPGARAVDARSERGEGRGHETHVPAEQPPPFPQARLPSAHVGPSGPSGDPQPSAQGPPPAERLIAPLRLRRDFERLAIDGHVRTAGPIRVRRAADPDLDEARFAFALPRSVGTAVVRNRLRRRLREIVRQLDRADRVTPGRYLVIATPAATSASFDELHASMMPLIASSPS